MIAKSLITSFTKLKNFYDRRENPTDEDIKNAGVKSVWDIYGKINETYNKPIPVRAYIQKMDGTVNKPLRVNIKLMDEETSFFGYGTGVYLGEMDHFAKYEYPNKYITVKKYKNDDMLIYHSDSTPKTHSPPSKKVGGKTKRNLSKTKTKTKKRYS